MKTKLESFSVERETALASAKTPVTLSVEQQQQAEAVLLKQVETEKGVSAAEEKLSQAQAQYKADTDKAANDLTELKASLTGDIFFFSLNLIRLIPMNTLYLFYFKY